MKWIRLCVFLFLILIVPEASAGKPRQGADFLFSGGWNNCNAYELELSTSYLFSEYIGLTLGVNFYNDEGFFPGLVGDFMNSMLGFELFDEMEMNRRYEGRAGNGMRWVVEGTSAYPIQLLFRPAVRFRSPILTLFEEWNLSINCEPGVYISAIPNERIEVNYYRGAEPFEVYPVNYDVVKNRGGEIFSWNVKSFFELEADRLLLGLGYTVSNFDIYNGRRNIIIEGTPLAHVIDDRKLSHTVFVSVGVRF